MGAFKKITISLYIVYLLLVFLSPSYIIHRCLSEQKTEIVKNLNEEFGEECQYCSHTAPTANYLEKSKTGEHSCCEQSERSSTISQEFLPKNVATHKSHNGLTSQCCSYSIINVAIDYFSPEKIKEVYPLNFLVAYVSLQRLVDNSANVLYLELPRQIRLPAKEFLSKLLTTIYFASLVG